LTRSVDKDVDDFETRKLEAMRPLMFEAGAALWDCQGFEYGLALQLYYFARLGIAGLDAAALKRILDNDDKRTAGYLVAMMKKHLLNSPIAATVAIETAIDEGLEARNLLIHRVLIDNAEMFVTPESRAALVKKIRALRRKVNAADKKLRPVIALLSGLVEGETMQEIERKVRDTFF
jgi:hypothetical protein